MMMLQGNKISKVYGGKTKVNSCTALSNIDLTIQEGDFVGVMGPSGSGKSTLLKILSGLDKPTTGSVHIKGVNLETLSSKKIALFRRQNIGFVFQDFNLLDSLTIKENIMLPLILEKKSVEYMENYVEKIMNLVSIDKLKDKNPYEVSGGEKQRCAVARSIINNPSIVYADEPTGNLDSKSSNDIMNCFKRLNEELNSTILMVTHDSFAASFCRKIIFIKDGEIYSQIVKKKGRKEFFNQILDCLAILGGGLNEA